MSRFFFLIAAVACAVAGCDKSKPTATEAKPNDKKTASAPVEPAPPPLDACGLLTSDEVKSVLGEPVQSTKPSMKTEGGFQVSQCYFALPTAVKSMSLTVILKGSGPGTRDPKAMWQETFHRDFDKDKDGNHGEPEEREKAKPQKIDGLGDEAFWTSNAVGGVLYTLKGNSYVRISIGGADKPDVRLQKSRALAEMVLKRL